MFINYFKIAFRNLSRHKISTITNITSLGLGIFCTILILLWLHDELSFDRFHENADDIYRICYKVKINNNDVRGADSPGQWAPVSMEMFPEVRNFTRYVPHSEVLVKYGKKAFYEKNGVMVDASFFKMFSFQFIFGDPETAFSDKSNIVITEEMALKYFEKKAVLGQILEINSNQLIVTGILKNIPSNSHIQFDFICPFNYDNSLNIDWGSTCFSSYLQLNKDAEIKRLETKIQDLIFNRVPIFKKLELQIILQPLTSIHLAPEFATRYNIAADKKSIMIFSIVAFLILFISCINFMNLSSAYATNRTKEIYIRKTVGSKRSQLIQQFLIESVLIAFLSFGMSLILVELFLPSFNQFVNNNIDINYSNFKYILGGAVIIFIAGILSGIYPALYLSAFNPIGIVSKKQSKVTRINLRNLLIVIQFSISIILISFTLLISEQFRFWRNMDLGFSKEHIVTIPIKGAAAPNYNILKNNLLQNPNISNVAAKNCLPPFTYDGGAIFLEGQETEQLPIMEYSFIDNDYLKTLNLEVIEGRNFSKDYPTDPQHACLVNEEVLKVLGIESGIGETIRTGRNDVRKIIGVVKNANFQSLKNKVQPIVFFHLGDIAKLSESVAFVKIAVENGTPNEKIISQTILNIEGIWKNVCPNLPFEYNFLDDTYNALYKSEHQAGKIFNWFSFLAILISCFGLFGLVSFTTQQRTKEIGIRKVVGSSVSGIVVLLTKEFTKWVLVANIIAWPIAYFAMNKWLQNFAYRINISWWMFVLSGGIALVIALLTVSYQAIRAATANPVEALRYE